MTGIELSLLDGEFQRLNWHIYLKTIHSAAPRPPIWDKGTNIICQSGFRIEIILPVTFVKWIIIVLKPASHIS